MMIDEVVLARLEQLVRAGAAPAHAAEVAGLDPYTFNSWLATDEGGARVRRAQAAAAAAAAIELRKKKPATWLGQQPPQPAEQDDRQLVAARPPRWLMRLRRDSHVNHLVSRAFKACPWLAPIDHPAVRAWAQLERLSAEPYARIRADGLLVRGANGEHPNPLIDKLVALRKAQTHLAAQLGLSPRARAEGRTGTSDVFEILVQNVEAHRDAEIE